MKRLRGSTTIGVNDDGAAELRQTGSELLVFGVPKKIYIPTDRRGIQSAFYLIDSWPLQPRSEAALVVQAPDPGWDTWAMGRYEGKTYKDYGDVIDELRLMTPWVVPPGMGALSTKPGESFDASKARIISRLWLLIAEIRKNPEKLYWVVTHSHVFHLLKAWLARYDGMPQPGDLDYDRATWEMFHESPGTAMHFHGCVKGPIRFEKIESGDRDPKTEAIFIRHGETDWS